MTVTVRLPNQLRSYAGGREFVDVAASTAAEALGELTLLHPELMIRLFDDRGRLHSHLAVFVRDLEVAREELDSTVVAAGDRLDLLIAVSGGAGDIRMRGFQERATADETLDAAFYGVSPLPPEPVSLAVCTGRVLAADVTSAVDVAPFRRVTMDG
jgi:molybdopterin converting factor small subunit